MKTLPTLLTARKPSRVLPPVRSRGWLLIFAAALVLCMSAGLINVLTSGFSPGSAWGIGYGVLSALLLAGAAAYSWRRRAPRRGPGAARHWLHFHVYGGILFLVLVMMHSGFRLPHGRLAWALWALSIWIVFSGLAGLLIQRWIPRLLTSGLTTEVNYRRIPELAAAIRQEADSLAESEPSIGRLYQSSLAPLMSRPRVRPIFFIDITGGVQHSLRQADHLRGFLDEGGLVKLDRLMELLKSKSELDAHFTLQKALRWWLYAHVPASLTLIVLVGFHVFSILYY